MWSVIENEPLSTGYEIMHCGTKMAIIISSFEYIYSLFVSVEMVVLLIK